MEGTLRTAVIVSDSRRHCLPMPADMRHGLFEHSAEIVIRLNSDLVLVNHGAVQPEDICKELIVGLTLVRSVIMTLSWEMDIPYILLCPIESPYALQIRVFELRDRSCPVAIVTDNEYRTWRHHGKNLRIAGATS